MSGAKRQIQIWKGLDEDHDEINVMIQEAYDAKERGESAPLEPLDALLAGERSRFNASCG